MWKRFLGIMAAALCVLNLTVGSAFSADLVKVPTAWLDEHETFLMWYAKEKGWDKEAGLDIEMKLFNSGPDILNALPAGELPTGVVVSVVGAPFFIYLIVKNAREVQS